MDTGETRPEGQKGNVFVYRVAQHVCLGLLHCGVYVCVNIIYLGRIPNRIYVRTIYRLAVQLA
jgi:hypothetical protein